MTVFSKTSLAPLVDCFCDRLDVVVFHSSWMFWQDGVYLESLKILFEQGTEIRGGIYQLETRNAMSADSKLGDEAEIP